MSSSPLRSISGCHARSISLPSRPHPLIPQGDEHLCRLRAFGSTSSSLSSVAERLSVLEGLYECLDDSLVLPHTQQVFSQQCHEKWVEDALDGFLRLLDFCAIAKDISTQTKQDLQGLLLTLRRRRDGSELGGYLNSRKNATKEIQKSLKIMKSIKSKKSILDSHNDHDTMAIATLLKEVEATTIAVFESLFSNLSGTKVKSRLNGFSLVLSKSKDEETNTNEFEKVDVALNALKGHKTSRFDGTIQVEEVQNLLQKTELSIRDIEQGLECLFRRLIKTRVSLLNILNH
ncbi:hypothetical protein RHGRI_032964 [Rhododendron griersonianum]|uniref:Uncharacterized protein n=1 Tax=Rhododendron griersonianum TaxID=479676 RepID=A0AAV6IDZ4_9ERIC|nr:hypothetical protein RHGRI_032964 [Rhododendron griersonianum]